MKHPHRSKTLSPLISFTLVVLIGILAISIALLSSTPVVERGIESTIVNEGFNNMNIFDNSVRELAREGAGSLRTLDIQISGGSYTVNSSTNSIYFDYMLKAGILSPNTSTKQGEIYVTTSGDGGVKLHLELNYTGISLSWDGNPIGKGGNRVCVRNLGQVNNTPVVSISKC